MMPIKLASQIIKASAKGSLKKAAKETDEIPRYTQSKGFKALEKAQKNSGPEAVIRDMEKAGAVALGSGFAGAAAGEAVFVVVTFGAICESKRMEKKIVLKL
jgi:NADH:ubiquinone oxidoreductase subunit F (NADH-binding)